MSTTIADAAALRRSIYDKGAANRTDLVGLIGLGPIMGDDPAYIELVAEVARDVLVKDADPPGHVSEDDADWLTARLGDGGGLACRAEYETLKSVLSHAASAPAALVAFAVREIERAILTGGRGPLGGAEPEPGVVTAEDVDALRAIVFAPRAGGARIDRATAEALFDIAHATQTANNDPGFDDLFAEAIGDYLSGAVFLSAPRREPSEPDGLADLIQSLGPAGPSGGDRHAEERYALEIAQTEARLDAAARIEAGEAKWVLAHLARGGELTAAEHRLLMRLRDASREAPRRSAPPFGRAA